MGLGPNFRFDPSSDLDDITTLGLRSFVKAEFLDQKGYLQFENVVDNGIKNTEDTHGIRHNPMIGGGYLLGLSRSWALNFAMFYQLTHDRPESQASSPFVFRIGISSIKPQHQKR